MAPFKFVKFIIIWVLQTQVNAFQHHFLDISINQKLLTTNVTPNTKKFLVELAIFCDYDFGQVFNFERTKIIKYWEALLYDVQLKYKTLQYVDISFQVNEIVVFENFKEQPFIESIRTPEDRIDMNQVIGSFQDWLYFQDISNYDIAVLAIGAKYYGAHVGLTSAKAACLVDNTRNKVLSSLAFTTKIPFAALNLAHEIAHLLGAEHDFDKECKSFGYKSSKTEQYIMGNPGNWFGTNSFYFSACSNHLIEEFLLSHQASNCLGRLTTNKPPIIDAANLYINRSTISSVGLSLEEQCKILLNNTSASMDENFEAILHSNYNFSIPNYSSCQATICKSDSTQRLLIPFDGSPCDNAEPSKVKI